MSDSEIISKGNDPPMEDNPSEEREWVETPNDPVGDDVESGAEEVKEESQETDPGLPKEPSQTARDIMVLQVKEGRNPGRRR